MTGSLANLNPPPGRRSGPSLATVGTLVLLTFALAVSATALLPGAHALGVGSNASASAAPAAPVPAQGVAGPVPLLSSWETVPPQLLATIPVGTGPDASVFDPGNGYVYAANEVSNNVSVLDGASVLASVPLSTANVTVGSPISELYDPANGYVYVIDHYLFEAAGGGVSVIDGTTLLTTLEVGLLPTAAAYDALNGLVYVTESGANHVAVIDGTTVVGAVHVGASPRAIAYDPSDGEVYVANHGSANVTVIDGSSVAANVPVGVQPDALVYDPMSGSIDVANNQSANVSVLVGSAESGTVPAGANPSSELYDPGLGDVYVTDANASEVTVLTGTTFVGNVPTGAGPGAAALNPATGVVYVTDFGANSVTAVNGTAVLGTVFVGRAPSSDVFDAADRDVYVTNVNSRNVSVLATAYALSFNETGLAVGAAWTVTVGAQVLSTTSAAVATGVLPGVYAYSAAGPAGFRLVAASPASPVTVVHAPVIVDLTFAAASNATYPLTFTESGLSSMCGRSTEWSVTVDNVTMSSTTSTIKFAEPNGTYAFSVTGPSGYTVVSESPISPVTIAGAGVSVSIEFGRGSGAPTTYTLTFSETGLPRGTTWCVNVGATYCSDRSDIVLSGLSAGTYSYTVSPVTGYTAQPSSGTVTIEHRDAQVDIRFSGQGSGHHCNGMPPAALAAAREL